MIAYEVAEDRTASLEDLNELLDRIGDAASRQKAKHDLPFARMRLAQKEAKVHARRTEAVAKQERSKPIGAGDVATNGAQPADQTSTR